jgi:hypothetical protein
MLNYQFLEDKYGVPAYYAMVPRHETGSENAG